jgi:hypothetical protein
MKETVQKADVEHRRKVLRMLILMGLTGLAVIFWGVPAFNQWIESMEPNRAVKTLMLVLVLLFMPLLLAGLYVLRMARMVFAGERFPPSGVKVVKDTVVLEGRRARRRAYLMVVYGLLLIFLALYGAVYFPSRFSELLGNKAGAPGFLNGVPGEQVQGPQEWPRGGGSPRKA